MILPVEIFVIFVRLSVEHLVETPAGVLLWWLVCVCELFQHKAKGTQSFFEPGNAVITSGITECLWDGPAAFRHLRFLS